MPELGPALAAVLAGQAAERVVDRFLRAHRTLGGDARWAVKEAIYGVAVWRRRLAWHATPSRSPLLLLAALLRDLAGFEAAEALLGVALPPPRPPPTDLAARFSLPDWLADALAREVGEEAAALADALNLPGPVALRPNLLRTTPAALAARLAAEGVETRRGGLARHALVVVSRTVNVYGSPSWRDGWFEVQDEASQLVGQLVDARPGEQVLDLCAGAGGKSLQLAAAVGPRGAVHAADPDAGRLRRLRERAARAGAAEVIRVHGASPPLDLRVDAALVDAPCSELGALRRGPDRRFSPPDFGGFPALQLDLLARAARHVHPGGRLTYAVCTLRREEGEEVARAFESSHPRWERRRGVDPGDASGFVRTWPHRHGADGFFAAAWRLHP